MKISKMNAHEKLAYKLMDNITREYIGGNENALLDYDEESVEYQSAYKFLHQGHENLKNYIYSIIMDEAKSKVYAQHIKFAGTKFIMERIEKRLIKMGY